MFVEGNNEADGNLDMLLMSRCKGHIIANSSFSWWASWLDNKAEKEIVSPAIWSQVGVCKDIIKDDFIKIDSDGKIVF